MHLKKCFSLLGRKPRFLRLIAGLFGIAVVPLSAQVVIDGDFTDWETIGSGGAVAELTIEDPVDMADSSGDLAGISVSAEGEHLILTMRSHGAIIPAVDETPDGMTNRYYYHWLIDSDNNPVTGVSNATYENTLTGVARAIGYGDHCPVRLAGRSAKRDLCLQPARSGRGGPDQRL